MDTPRPLFRKIDCLRLPVPDLEAGLRFYRDQQGHALRLRSGRSRKMLSAKADVD